ncbi:MAG: DUF2281 domain-containing protein [Candidatus Poribacteria bacterium]
MNRINESVKERLFTVIEQLPEEITKEVLDFTESLLARERVERLKPKFSPENNPILEYIGGISHGTLARNIDDELYGGNS